MCCAGPSKFLGSTVFAQVADSNVGHQLPDLCHLSRELMTDDERRLAAPLRPIVPFVDMHVGAAYTRAPDTDQHFVVADRGNRNVLQHEAWTGGLLYEGFHSVCPSSIVVIARCAQSRATSA